MTRLKAFAANRIYTFGRRKAGMTQGKILWPLQPIREGEREQLFDSLTCTPHRIIHQLCTDEKEGELFFFLLPPSILQWRYMAVMAPT